MRRQTVSRLTPTLCQLTLCHGLLRRRACLLRALQCLLRAVQLVCRALLPQARLNHGRHPVPTKTHVQGSTRRRWRRSGRGGWATQRWAASAFRPVCCVRCFFRTLPSVLCEQFKGGLLLLLWRRRLLVLLLAAGFSGGRAALMPTYTGPSQASLGP